MRSLCIGMDGATEPSRIKESHLFLGIYVLLICALFPACAANAETKTFVAFSLNAAHDRVQMALNNALDFRKIDPELFYLGGITKPWALVRDNRSGDWILVGENDAKSSTLTLDDWVVALRARFTRPDEDPGVTIEPFNLSIPVTNDHMGSHWPLSGGQQTVRFFGGIENTHFGHVCYEADWLLKNISLGKEKLPNTRIESWFDINVENLRHGIGRGRNVLSRGWFYPVVNRVNVFPDVVLLEKFQLGVLTEILGAEIDGRPVSDLSKFVDLPTDAYSKSFNQNYDAAARERPVLDTLRGLARLAALAKGLTMTAPPDVVAFFLARYPVAREDTPKEAPLLTAVDNKTHFRASGGVQLTVLAERLRAGDANALRDIIVAARTTTGQTALTWSFDIDVENGRLKSVSLPKNADDTSNAPFLFTQAQFYLARGKYALAVDWYSQFLSDNQYSSEGYMERGVAYSRSGDHNLSMEDYNHAINLDPDNAISFYNRGVEFAKYRNDNDRAIADYSKAIELDSVFYDGWLARSVQFQAMKDYTRADTDIKRAIALNPNDYRAYFLRGEDRMTRLKNYGGAITDFDCAIADYEGTSGKTGEIQDIYFWRANCHSLRNEDDLAVQDWNAVISYDPADYQAYFNLGQAQERRKASHDAIVAFRKFLQLSNGANPDDGVDAQALAKRKIGELTEATIPRDKSVVFAMDDGDDNKVASLIRDGADVDEMRNGGTALMFACGLGREETVRFLIQSGAGMNWATNKGKTTAIEAAADGGFDKIVEILIDHGADVNPKDANGFTPLMRACYQGYPDTVAVLVKGGADISLKTPHGASAISIARERGYPDIAAFLEGVSSTK